MCSRARRPCRRLSGRPSPSTTSSIGLASGTNRAAIAIDWSDGSTSPPALVWGFRWDGTAHGRDMLTAVVNADNRLYAKFGGSPGSESAIYGLGYDASNDGNFAVDDGTSFDSHGVAFTDPADLAGSVDPADYYAEGWFTGFWHYGVAATNPFAGGAWTDSPIGMASRTLADGSWDSWAFQSSTVPPFTTFANNPQATAAPPGGDFNGDGRVDSADYDIWKTHLRLDDAIGGRCEWQRHRRRRRLHDLARSFCACGKRRNWARSKCSRAIDDGAFRFDCCVVCFVKRNCHAEATGRARAVRRWLN